MARAKGLGFRVYGWEVWIYSLWFGGLRFRVQSVRRRVWDSGLRVLGAGFRAEGSGLKV